MTRPFCASSPFLGRTGPGSVQIRPLHAPQQPGQAVWLEATYNPIRDGSGKVVRVVKFASDITARIEQNHATREAARLAHSTAQETLHSAEEGGLAARRGADLFPHRLPGG